MSDRARASVPHLLAAVALAGLASCFAEIPDTSVVSDALTCTGFGCNSNSPVIAGAPFSELHRDSAVTNLQGLRIVDFRSANGTPFQVDVQQARLVGLDSSGAIALDTIGMSNAVLRVQDAQSRTWRIRIAEIGSIAYWAPPMGVVTTYRLKISASGGDETDLCNRPPEPTGWPSNVFNAILFEGDRYDPVAKTVLATGPATAGWFNIACAGSVPAKLLLNRHTSVSANPLKPTNVPQRQTLLRAYAAAVCWGSDAFTAMGEPLLLYDRQEVMPKPTSLANVEGLWGPVGAICLGEQRLVHARAMPQADADNVLLQMTAECPSVPACSTIAGFPGNWKQQGLVLTLNL